MGDCAGWQIIGNLEFLHEEANAMKTRRVWRGTRFCCFDVEVEIELMIVVKELQAGRSKCKLCSAEQLLSTALWLSAFKVAI